MLNGKQIKALNLLVLGTMKDKDIASEVNITQKTISVWKNENVEFQEEYNKLCRKSIQFSATKALRRQISLLNSKNEMVAHLAAKDLLDRAGFTPDNNVKLSVSGDMDLTFNIDYGDSDEGSSK